MAKSIDRLAVDLRATARRVRVESNKLMKRMVHATATTAIRATPVDTGKARSNYIGSIGVGSSVRREPYAPGDKLGIGESANAEAAVAQVDRAASTFDVSRDSTFVISNNVEYIHKLDRGTSAQNRAGGFAKLGIMAAQVVLKQVKLLGR